VSVEEYDASTYGQRIARVYDAWHEERFARQTVEAVSFLLDAAGEGPVLELGVGTGRLAIPLADQGLRVHGIDGSRRMVAAMRAKPGGRRVRVTIGDFERFPMTGSFSLVFVAFNTFFGLLSQEAQVRCFRHVARHLQPGGRFVVEAFVPDLSRFDDDQRTSAVAIDTDSVRLDASLHDPVEQRVTAGRVVLLEGRVELYPVQLRYAFPSELDLMARLAGMRLRERWSNWRRDPFTSESRGHVSLYELARTTASTPGVRRIR
jgi:SAM-dependent methyltransferase